MVVHAFYTGHSRISGCIVRPVLNKTSEKDEVDPSATFLPELLVALVNEEHGTQ